ncbi:MAG: peptidase [Frankiales bacterium]|nr:peptidase [Frankiales bacterium]
MPPAPAHDAPRRSPGYVRALLLGACALGLLGLAPGHHQHASRLSAVTTPLDTVGTVDLEPRPPHPGEAATLVAQRASRSRTVLPPKKPAARKHHAAVRVADRWMAPNPAPVVSPFGMRWGSLHKGLDFGAGYGSPIVAAGDGVVVGSGYLGGENGYGLITIIQHSNGFYTAYAHQSRAFVSDGQQVTAGEIIGLVGSTGHSTGPHLHFEVRTWEHGGQIDPRPWLRARGVDV